MNIKDLLCVRLSSRCCSYIREGKSIKDDCPCETSVGAGRWTVSNKGVNCVVYWSAVGTMEKKKAEQGAGHGECRGEGKLALLIRVSLISIFCAWPQH